MRGGRLDRLITIQRKTSTRSDSGEPQESWETVVLRRRAGMKPVRGDEQFNVEQLVAKEQIEFTVRYSADVAALSPMDRIIHPALPADSPLTEPQERAIHDVQAVHEIGRREGLRILTFRRPDVAAS
jgi:SPP1 family predicted phage head-tail adaptor